MLISVKRLNDDAQTAKKVRLEAGLERAVLRHFRQLLRDFDRVFPLTGAVPNVDDLRQSTIATLEAHFTRTQEAFSGQVAQDIGQVFHPDIDRLAAFAFGAWVADRAFFSGSRIIATARNRMALSIEQARQVATDAGTAPTNQQALAAGKRIATPILRRQAKLVATNETQAASEAVKSITSEAATGSQPRIIQGIPAPPAPPPTATVAMEKTWGTQQDERVRGRHVVTDGQRVNVLDLFDVGGQSMMHPGDTSHGADLANVIRCRCFSFYERI